MNFLIYIIQVNLAIVVFWALYRAVFIRLTFFHWNRFLLLGFVVLSFLLPLFQLKWTNPAGTVADLGGIDWSYMDHLANTPVSLTKVPDQWSTSSVLFLIYMAVLLGSLLRSAFRFRQIGLLTTTSRRIRKGRVRIYVQDHHTGSFTLFRSIYLDRFTYEKRLSPVLRHEMVHAFQLHSVDLLFMDLVVAMLWFNPFVYVLLRYVRDNHEYLADHYARGSQKSLKEYLECLKAESVRYFSPVPASFFKNSTIKKRIIMLTNHKTKNSKKWRYLGILPAMALMIILFHSPAEQSMAISAFIEEGSGVPSKFPLPVEYREKITWGYNQHANHPITGKETTHHGIDLAAPTGTPVFASADGVVSKAENEQGWGKMVVVAHDHGYTTFYAHLDEILVESGAEVSKGEVIGRVGNTGQSTGSHLHYEVRMNGNHMNPTEFF